MGLGVGLTPLPCKNSFVTKSKEENTRLLKGNRLGNGLRTLHIGTWNVRTLYYSRGLQFLIEEFNKYNIDLLAIQEMRWIGEGTIEKKNHTIYYSCEKKKHIFGTGFLLSKKIKHLVIDFVPQTSRLCKIRLRGRFFNYSIINAHAPTEEKNGEEKEQFYEDLYTLYRSCPRHDVKIILGDMNAKIGREDVFRPTIGKHSLHESSNDNGQRLIHFANENGMTISSTCFDHKRIHKETWCSPDGETRNQIDHVLIDSRHGSDIQDVRTFRGANCDSDHFLVIAKLKAKISNVRKLKGESFKRVNCARLNDEVTRNNLQANLNEALRSANLVEIEGVENKWSTLKDAIINTANDILGTMKKAKPNDWFDQECMLLSQTKMTAYKNMLQKRHSRRSVEDYKQARREEKRVHRAKKRFFHKDHFKDVEYLRESNASKDFFREINLGRKEFKPRVTACRDKDKIILNDRREVLHRWNEYFSELLNKNSQDVVLNTPIFSVNNEIVPHPTLMEVKEGIKKLKKNKAPGPDFIPSELIKNAAFKNIDVIYHLIDHVWTHEVLPEDWKLSITCPIHKKGDVLECSNYRGISLLCTFYKLFSTILFNRLTAYCENIIGDYQCGFRRGRSTVEQIFNLRQVIEKTREFDINTHYLFIDFKTAYDSVNRELLLQSMREFNIPEKLIRLVAITLSETKLRVKIQNNLSEPISFSNGLRQGDALACLLFNLALQKIVKDSAINTRGTIFYKSVQIFAFADDIVIVARTLEALKQAFISLVSEAKKMHLLINQTKTKYMTSTSFNDTYIAIGDYKFEVVSGFTYLGSELNSVNDVTPEVHNRVIAGNKCFYGICKYLKSNLISRKTKLQLYKTLIRPIVVYAAETWTMTESDKEILAIFERKILRSILGGVKVNDTWRRRSNFELYNLYREPDIINYISIQRLKWAGHIIRMEDDRVTKKIFNAKPFGTRKRGRPRIRWIDSLETDMKVLGVKNWKILSKERAAWRSILRKAMAHPGLKRH